MATPIDTQTMTLDELIRALNQEYARMKSGNIPVYFSKANIPIAKVLHVPPLSKGADGLAVASVLLLQEGTWSAM